MGQFANNWNQIKTLIRQKDDAIDRQSAQLAAVQSQLALLQQQQLDADDQNALAEVHQTVMDNALAPAPDGPAAPPSPSTPAVKPAPSAAVTTFTR